MDTSRPDPLARQADRTATCPAHGEYTAKHIIGNRWSECQTCANEMREQRKREAEEAEARAKKQLDEEWLNLRLKRSGLVGRFKEATFDNFEATEEPQRKALTSCRDFAESVSRTTSGLWLIGPPGTGKTHLGSAIVNHVIRQRSGRAGIYSAREIVRMLRRSWSVKVSSGFDWNWPETEDEVIDFLGNDLSLLVLDEVGVTFGSDAEQVQLFDVLDLRYRNQLPTVVLSNLPPAEMKPVLGDRLYDRLREGASLVTCKWASHRGQA